MTFWIFYFLREFDLNSRLMPLKCYIDAIIDQNYNEPMSKISIIRS